MVCGVYGFWFVFDAVAIVGGAVVGLGLRGFFGFQCMGFWFRSLGFEGSNVQGRNRTGVPRLSWTLNNVPF